MKNKLVISVLVVCLLWCAWYFDLMGQNTGHGVQYPVSQVLRMDLEEVVTSLGKLEPATYVDVGAQISGQIIKLHVALGDYVKKDDLLAEIDPRSFIAMVEADKATLANLEAALAERRAVLIQSQRNFERYSSLKQQKVASDFDALSYETAYQVAEAQVAAVEAQIRQAQATLENDELNLSYCRIYAPMSGTVVSLPVKEGETLNNKQSTPTLMRIAELEVMTVWAAVSEADINKVSPGMEVYFSTIGNPMVRHYAKVEKIHPSYTEENDVILYDVTFNVNNPDGQFLPAMNTQVFFVRAQAKDVLAVPAEVLPSNLRNQPSAVLTVVKPGGALEERDVSFGVRTRNFIQVLSGLQEGDSVLKAASASELEAARHNSRYNAPKI